MSTLLPEDANASKPIETKIKIQFFKDASSPKEHLENSETLEDEEEILTTDHDHPSPPSSLNQNFSVLLKGVPIRFSAKEEIIRCWEAATGNVPSKIEIGEEIVFMCVSNIQKEKMPQSFLMKRQTVVVEIDPFYCRICNIPYLAKINIVRTAINLSLGDFKFKLDNLYLDTAIIYLETEDDMKQFIIWVENELLFVLGSPIKICKDPETYLKEQENKANYRDSLEEMPFCMDYSDLSKKWNTPIESKSDEKHGIIIAPRMATILNVPKVYSVPVAPQIGTGPPIIPTAHRAFMPVRPTYRPTQETVESIVKRGTKRKHNPTRMIEIINTTKRKDPQETGVLWMFTSVSSHQIPFIAINWTRFYNFYKIDQDQPQILDRTIREKFQPSKCKRDRKDPNSESEWREVDRNQMATEYHVPLPQSGHYDTLYTFVPWWTDLGLEPPAKKRRPSVNTSQPTTASQVHQGTPLTAQLVNTAYAYAPEMPITKKDFGMAKMFPTPLQAIPISNQSFFLSPSSYIHPKGPMPPPTVTAQSIPATTSPPILIPPLTQTSPFQPPVSRMMKPEKFEKFEETMGHT